MMNIRSSSTSSGFSTITVTFEIGRNPDLAAVDVQNWVNQALGRMPAEVRTDGIVVTRTRPVFLARSASSHPITGDSLFISNHRRSMRDASSRIPGVGNIIIFGERKFAMRLWLDPARLALYG
jgi:HAE1 family hydrophobic/amphiphilic exporter-1